MPSSSGIAPYLCEVARLNDRPSHGLFLSKTQVKSLKESGLCVTTILPNDGVGMSTKIGQLKSGNTGKEVIGKERFVLRVIAIQETEDGKSFIQILQRIKVKRTRKNEAR